MDMITCVAGHKYYPLKCYPTAQNNDTHNMIWHGSLSLKVSARFLNFKYIYPGTMNKLKRQHISHNSTNCEHTLVNTN